MDFWKKVLAGAGTSTGTLAGGVAGGASGAVVGGIGAVPRAMGAGWKNGTSIISTGRDV